MHPYLFMMATVIIEWDAFYDAYFGGAGFVAPVAFHDVVA
jgi:hypothetical protein